MLCRSVLLQLALVVATLGVTEAHISPGDMNCDGIVNGLDIPLFVACVLTGDCDHCGIQIDTIPIGHPGNPTTRNATVAEVSRTFTT